MTVTVDTNAEGWRVTYCWDCETATIGNATRCRSCQDHYETCDGPHRYEEPVHVTDDRGRSGQLYSDIDRHEWLKVGRIYYRNGKRGRPFDPQPVIMSWYCHGAGPDGNRPGLLDEMPRSVRGNELGMQRGGMSGHLLMGARSR